MRSLPLRKGGNVPKWLQLRSRLCPDCGADGEWERGGGVGDEDRPAETGEQQASARPGRSRRSVRKPSVQTETKHIELMVVNDNDMVRSPTLAGVPLGFPWLQEHGLVKAEPPERVRKR